jgi:hypothetical protein
MQARANHAIGKSTLRAEWRIVALVGVGAIYCASFFFPVQTGKPFGSDHVSTGWEAFIEVLDVLFNENTSGSAFGVILPNFLMWIGLACLWWRLPYFSFAAGLFATPIAAGWMLWFELFSVSAREDVKLLVAHNLGAYLWLTSMAALAVAGFWHCSQQTCRHHRRAESYPELCEAAEKTTPKSP